MCNNGNYSFRFQKKEKTLNIQRFDCVPVDILWQIQGEGPEGSDPLKWSETKIRTTERSHMTIIWLI